VALPATDDFKAWVGLLADQLRSKGAFWHLVLSGRAARSAATEGLADPNPDVRRQCARVLDHLADESSFANLAGMLSDPDHQVRIAALHALACDRCKESTCRPEKEMALRPVWSRWRTTPTSTSAPWLLRSSAVTFIPTSTPRLASFGLNRKTRTPLSARRRAGTPPEGPSSTRPGRGPHARPARSLAGRATRWRLARASGRARSVEACDQTSA
jgi:hypothetical protein